MAKKFDFYTLSRRGDLQEQLRAVLEFFEFTAEKIDELEAELTEKEEIIENLFEEKGYLEEEISALQSSLAETES